MGCHIAHVLVVLMLRLHIFDVGEAQALLRQRQQELRAEAAARESAAAESTVPGS